MATMFDFFVFQLFVLGPVILNCFFLKSFLNRIGDFCFRILSGISSQFLKAL